MNEKLQQLLADILDSLSLRHHCKRNCDSVDQIGSYHGRICLVEFTDSKFCVGTHQRGNHGHIMILNHTLEQVCKDFLGKKHILPLVIVTIKHGSKSYARIQPGILDRIMLTDMSKEMFDVFIKLQKLVYKP